MGSSPFVRTSFSGKIGQKGPFLPDFLLLFLPFSFVFSVFEPDFGKKLGKLFTHFRLWTFVKVFMIIYFVRLDIQRKIWYAINQIEDTEGTS